MLATLESRVGDLEREHGEHHRSPYVFDDVKLVSCKLKDALAKERVSNLVGTIDSHGQLDSTVARGKGFALFHIFFRLVHDNNNKNDDDDDDNNNNNNNTNSNNNRRNVAVAALILVFSLVFCPQDLYYRGNRSYLMRQSEQRTFPAKTLSPYCSTRSLSPAYLAPHPLSLKLGPAHAGPEAGRGGARDLSVNLGQ